MKLPIVEGRVRVWDVSAKVWRRVLPVDAQEQIDRKTSTLDGNPPVTDEPPKVEKKAAPKPEKEPKPEPKPAPKPEPKAESKAERRQREREAAERKQREREPKREG